MDDQDSKPFKGNKLDLIFNILHPIEDQQGLTTQFFDFGSVYLGGKQAVTEQYIYQKYIGAVITIMDRKSYEKEKIGEKIIALGLQHNHLYIDVKDSKDVKIQQYFPQIQAFFDKVLEEKVNVLIHCKGGMSRSPSFLCGFIMKKFKLSFEQAYRIIKERRSVVSINEGFQKQLLDWQKKLKQPK